MRLTKDRYKNPKKRTGLKEHLKEKESHKKSPEWETIGACGVKRKKATTYSTACGSTIGAAGLNGRVRDGNGWGPCAGVTFKENQ